MVLREYSFCSFWFRGTSLPGNRLTLEGTLLASSNVSIPILTTIRTKRTRPSALPNELSDFFKYLPCFTCDTMLVRRAGSPSTHLPTLWV